MLCKTAEKTNYCTYSVGKYLLELNCAGIFYLLTLIISLWFSLQSIMSCYSTCTIKSPTHLP